MVKRFFVKSSLVAIACTSCVVAYAFADETKAINVPAGELIPALKTLAEQSGVELVYRSEQLDGLRTRGVSGMLTSQQATTKLLEDTGLTVTMDPSGAMLVAPSNSDRRRSDAYSRSNDTKAQRSFWDGFRVAQVGQGEAGSIATSTGTSSSDTDKLEEVVVTGTLLQQPSGFTTPTPVTVVGQDFINARAPSDAGELMREIPSLKITSGPSVTGAGQRNSVGQSNVNFYGLGPARTLVLIDGQRQTASEVSSTVDVSTIPTLMIERVETITGGASATYGADAVGGVANFILKNKIDGVTVNAAWGSTDHGDKEVTNLNLGFGTDLGSRVNLLVGVDLTRDTGIDSTYSRDWGREEPGLFAYGNASAARGAQPASVWVNNYEQKNNTPGGIISGCTPPPCSASLTGIAFDTNGNPYSFAAGTTTASSAFMYGNTSNFGNNPSGQPALSAAYKRWTGMAKLNVDLTDETKLRLTVGYSGMTGEERVDVVQNSTTVTTANPFLPASIRNAMIAAGKTSITVGRTNYDLGYDYTGQVNRLFTAGAELTGKIAGSWSYDSYYKFSESTADAWQDGFRTADINAAFSNCTVVTADTSPGCVGYNIFGVGRASQAALDYLTQYTQGFRLLTKQNVVQGLVRGTPFATWAGEVNVAAGAHYRKDAISRTPTRDSARFPTGGFSFGNYTTFAAERNVKEYFAETNVPLVKDVPIVQALNANLGYRYLDYSDNGPWNTWKVGLTWDMNEQVRVRATRSRDIRSPHLFQQYGTGSTNLVTNAVDPRTNQTIVVDGGGLPVVNGANPALRPEVAATTTAGIILQPHWVSGLRLSADYFRIKIGDVITGTSQQQLINACLSTGSTDLCQLITFGSNGAIRAVRISNVNFNQLDVAGYNGEIAYAIPGRFLAGNWDVRGLVTYMDKYETTDKFANIVYDDIATSTGGQSRLQTNILLTYKHADFSTTVSWRYFSGLKYSSSSNGIKIGPDDPLYYSMVNSTTAAPCPGGTATCPWYQTATNSISRNKFPGASYLNWSAQYQIGGTPLKDFQVYVKVDNVLDKDPPEFAYAAFSLNPYDTVGRNYKVGLRANF